MQRTELSCRGVCNRVSDAPADRAAKVFLDLLERSKNSTGSSRDDACTFCEQLRDAGERAFKDANAHSSAQRVDAFRFLAQNLGQAFDLALETRDAGYPALHTFCGPTRKLGGGRSSVAGLKRAAGIGPWKTWLGNVQPIETPPGSPCPARSAASCPALHLATAWMK